ncbi:MAG: response regulator [Planctomycetales bacterium]|nr:response regulator [Planctomycetales bacterium]
MTIQVVEFEIKRPQDIAWAVQRARVFGLLAGLSSRRAELFGASVEAALEQSREAAVELSIAECDDRQAIQIVIRRSAVSTLPADCSIEFRDREGIDQADVTIDGGIQHVTLIVDLPETTQRISSVSASEWAITLSQTSAAEALVSNQSRIAMLADQLEQAQAARTNLQNELDHLHSLHDTLELLALVASKTDNAVVILDSNHCVEWVNDSFVRMTGFEQAEVYQKPLSQLLYSDAANTEIGGRIELETALAKGHGLSQEILHTRKDGRTFWASLSVTPAFDDEGRLHRWIGIASDATRQRREQEQLSQAKDAAENANRVKSEFLANMSHELRTPMNAIIGMADLALETDLTDEQKEYVSTILDSAENLSRLLNDILDLSKIEAQKLVIDSVTFDLHELLYDATKPFAFQANRIGIDFKLEIAENVVRYVTGDPTRIRQVIANLVGNAIKFTSEGQVTVCVKSIRKSKRTQRISISVTDSGIGISSAKLSHVFESFTQADNSISRRFGGTGLGLTISKQLVDLMGGKLKAQSAVSVGSTFTVELPLRIAGVTDQAAVPHTVLGSESSRSLRVLVTDDNRANRSLARRILEKAGHDVVEACDGMEAVRELQSQDFDVVLMDVQMPDLDGFETTAMIRQSKDSSPQPYIIAVTAHAMHGDRERCLAAGMDAYVTKPLRSKQLLALVHSVETIDDEEPNRDPLLDGVQMNNEHDFSLALARLEGDRELLIEQMTFYLEDSPILVRDIQSAIETQNGKQLEMSAHRLRGLSAAFDATGLVEVASQLEVIGRENRCDTPASDPDELAREWNRLCGSIQRYIAQHR